MRILLCNKFYYRRGGDCIYMLNLEQLLKEHGHEVAVFAMQYPENFQSKWSKYWPKNMSNVDALIRPFGSKQVRKGFSRLIDDFNPDVVHLNNIHTQLSPVIAEIAHKRGLRVVWTIHDLKLLCPRYDCLQNGKALCKECFKDKKNVLKHKCMKDSLPASVIAYLEAIKWSRERLEACTDTFICPSQFMADRMLEGGFDERKIKVLCNFIDVEKCKMEMHERGDYYCYVGRLSHEKGVKTLIEAAKKLPYPLVVVGGGTLEEELRAMAADDKRIVFAGQKSWEDVKKIVGGAQFNVLPSVVYENNSQSVLEAKCLGTPVLGARIGGIPELLEEGETGMTFESGNADDLQEKIEKMKFSSFDHHKIAEDAQKQYNSEEYEKNLENFYRGGIIFVGYRNWDEIKDIVSHAQFMVIPSEWYENNPLSVIEAQCLGAPVLGSRIGGIPELIEQNFSGMTFESGDIEGLKKKITEMWNNAFEHNIIAENAVKRYSSEAYYEKLLEYYKM